MEAVLAPLGREGRVVAMGKEAAAILDVMS